MILKEAFTYMNTLHSLLDKLRECLRDSSYTTAITRTHNKSKVCKAAEDVSETITSESLHGVSATTLLAMLNDVIAEYESCNAAISKAKRSLDIDIDATLAVNKMLHPVISMLEGLTQQRSSSVELRGQDYTFNNEGNQVPYYYNYMEVRNIDYDRNAVRTRLKDLRALTSKQSNAVDAAMINTQLDFTPRWDIDIEFLELMSEYIAESTQA